MDSVVLQMIEEYQPKSTADYENALKEIMQEIALLGLWRAKFYEHALFYGGTALRILYQLPRFSEDLDFCLLKKDDSFQLEKYYEPIRSELEAFGFTVRIDAKEKNEKAAIESAFIKASTQIHLLKVSAPLEISEKIQGSQSLKIKIEIDTAPPGYHGIEVRDLYRPIPFQVKTMPLTDLFAGKVHAVLARKWKNRAKGRDFYDYLWYLRKKTPLHLRHLQERLHQSGHLSKETVFTEEACREMLRNRFEVLDAAQAKQDVEYFLNPRERDSLDLWTNDYFIRSVDRLTFAGEKSSQ